MGCLHAVRRNIGSRVTDGNMSKSTSVHVVLHITSDGLDVRCGLVGIRLVIDDLVAGEESQRIVVFGEHLNSGKDALEIQSIV